eukprot:3000958-Pyramimonas_sp.AAC.1
MTSISLGCLAPRPHAQRATADGPLRQGRSGIGSAQRMIETPAAATRFASVARAPAVACPARAPAGGAAP